MAVAHLPKIDVGDMIRLSSPNSPKWKHDGHRAKVIDKLPIHKYDFIYVLHCDCGDIIKLDRQYLQTKEELQ